MHDAALGSAEFTRRLKTKSQAAFDNDRFCEKCHWLCEV